MAQDTNAKLESLKSMLSDESEMHEAHAVGDIHVVAAERDVGKVMKFIRENDADTRMFNRSGHGDGVLSGFIEL